MTKAEFRKLFRHALDRAAENAEARLGRPISRAFQVELHAPGFGGQLVSVEAAFDRLYLGSKRFYKIIDVAIKELRTTGPVAFVRVSGHEPVEFAKTWDPAESGPFKQIEASPIEDRRRRTG